MPNVTQTSLGGNTYGDLTLEPFDMSHGHPLGYGDWRIAVEVAMNPHGRPLGTFILGTDKLGSIVWTDVTEDFEGATFTRGGVPGNRPMAGQMQFRLRNLQRQWSPTASVYHGPGTLVRVVVGDGVETIPVFTGLTRSWNEMTDGNGNVSWVDITAMEPVFLLSKVNDAALASPYGTGQTLAQRLNTISLAAEYPFGWRFSGNTPIAGYTLQGTNLAQDMMTELLLAVDSIDYMMVPSKSGAIDVRARADIWVDSTIETLGDDVPVVADSLVTANDDTRLLSDVSLARAGGTAIHFTNSIAARYQKRSTQRMDLITQNPGADQDLIIVKEGLLGRGMATYRPVSVQLDSGNGDQVFKFLILSDIGNLVNVTDGTTLFSGYSISGISHSLTPMNSGAVHWSAVVQFDIEIGSDWSLV